MGFRVRRVPCIRAEGSPLPGEPLALLGRGGAGRAALCRRSEGLPWGCAHCLPHPVPSGALGPAHLSDLLEPVGLHVGKDVALGPGEDLKGHGTVMVLQGRDVVVADGQLRAGVDLVPATGGENTPSLGHPWDHAPPGSPDSCHPFPQMPSRSNSPGAGRPQQRSPAPGTVPRMRSAVPSGLSPHRHSAQRAGVWRGEGHQGVFPFERWQRPWAGLGFAHGLRCEGREWTCTEPPRRRGTSARTVGVCAQTDSELSATQMPLLEQLRHPATRPGSDAGCPPEVGPDGCSVEPGLSAWDPSHPLPLCAPSPPRSYCRQAGEGDLGQALYLLRVEGRSGTAGLWSA